jgi:hypothetical protein
MRPDIYTKAVLTVIAIMLTVIACKPLFSPDTIASAQSATFGAVQQTGTGCHPSFFDTRTGEFWQYHVCGGASGIERYRLTKLGQPIIKE